MKPRQYQLWLPAALLGALLSTVAPAASASASLSLPARAVSAVSAVSIDSPFHATPAIEVRPVSSVSYVADPMAPVDFRAVTHGVETASPGAGDEFYVDWVSPLQAPRGPAAADLTAPGAFSELDPVAAFAVSADSAMPLSIPEPGSLALLGAATLPLAALLRRRR